MLSPTAPDAIPMALVTSSKLVSIGYDHALFILRAHFKSNNPEAIYDYFDVPPEVHDALMAAPSLGSYFGSNIAGPRGGPAPYNFAKVGTPQHTALWSAALDDFGTVDDGSSQPPTVAELNTIPAPKDKELPPQQSRAPEPASEPEYIAPVALPSDREGLEKRAVEVEGETRALVIVSAGWRAVLTTKSPEGYAHAVAVLLSKKDEMKRALAEVAKIKDPATAAWKAACAFENKVKASYQASIDALDQAVTDYRRETQEAERRAEEETRRARQKVLDDAARVAAEEASRKAAEDAAALRAVGQHEVAAEVEAAPAYVRREVAPTEVARTAVPTVAGARVSGTWKFRVDDPTMVPRFYVDQITIALHRAGLLVAPEKMGALTMEIAAVFSQFHSLDEVKIGGRVRPLKEAAVDMIPGVRVWFDEKTGSTGR